MSELKKRMAEAEESEFSFSDLLEIIYRRALALLIVAAIVFLAAVYLALQPRKYSADGSLRIEPGAAGQYSTSPISALAGAGGSQKIASESEILQSRTVFLRVAQELNLVNQPAFWGVRHLKTHSLDDPKWRDLTLQRMHLRINVDHSPSDEIVRIRATTTSPELSAQIVNTLVNVYIEDLFKMRYGANQRVSKWLIGQLDDLKQQIEKDQTTLIHLQSKLGLIGLDDKSAKYLPAESLDDFTKAESQATINRIVAEARYRFLSETNPNLIESEQPLLSPGPSAGQGLLQTLRDSRARAAATYASLSSRFGPKYPAVIQAKAELDSDTAQVDAEQNRILNQSKLAFNAAKANEDLTRGAVAKGRADASQSQDDMVKYSILLHDYEGHRALYEGLIERLREAGITSGLESGEIDVVDLAEPPYFASSTSPLLILFVGLIAGLASGCFVALVIELFDTKVSTFEQAEKISHLPLLALIPQLTVNEKHGFEMKHLPEVASSPRSHYAEALQSFRSSLSMFQGNSPARVILVTSSLPGEGKSTTSRNIAYTFSLHHARTLLIDCDMRRGKIAEAFGISNSIGLSNVLAGRASMKEAITPICDADSLFVLPSGVYPPQASVLLSSHTMDDLIEHCKQEFDCIILDCPPVIGLSDAISLSRLSESVVVVVREEYSLKRALEAASKSLAKIDNQPVGFVMNGISSRSQSYGFGRYYDAYFQKPDAPSK